MMMGKKGGERAAAAEEEGEEGRLTECLNQCYLLLMLLQLLLLTGPADLWSDCDDCKSNPRKPVGR